MRAISIHHTIACSHLHLWVGKRSEFFPACDFAAWRRAELIFASLRTRRRWWFCWIRGVRPSECRRHFTQHGTTSAAQSTRKSNIYATRRSAMRLHIFYASRADHLLRMLCAWYIFSLCALFYASSSGYKLNLLQIGISRLVTRRVLWTPRNGLAESRSVDLWSLFDDHQTHTL